MPRKTSPLWTAKSLSTAFAVAILFSVTQPAFGAGKAVNLRCGGGCPAFYLAPRVTFGRLSVTDNAGAPVVDFVSDTSVGIETNISLYSGPAMSLFFFYSLDKLSYVPPANRTIAPTSNVQHGFRLMAYYKDMGGRFFLGVGGEFRQSSFLDRVNATQYGFETKFFPRGIGQLLMRLWGGGKGGPPCFLELEAGYRLAVQSTSVEIASGIDFAGQIFYTIGGDKMDFRLGIRGALEGFPAVPRQQKNLAITGVIGFVFN